jgi:hypothetical protein
MQLIIEREAGRVFSGWNEGKICFAPTYKYTHNSDAYAGETAKSKKKRRTPAWYVLDRSITPTLSCFISRPRMRYRRPYMSV